MLKIFSSRTLTPKASKSRGIPVAQVVRKRDGREIPLKTIYIKDDEYAGDGGGKDDDDDDERQMKDEEDEDFYDDFPKDQGFSQDFYKQVRNISSYNTELLRKAIRENAPDILKHARPATQFEYLMERFRTANTKVEEQKNKWFTIGQGQKDTYIKFIPPLPTVRLSVLGPSGVGKSTWINGFLETFERMKPGAMEYAWMFSGEDPAYSKRKKMEQMKLDETVISNPPHAEEFPPCIHIFDDIESLPKDISEAVSRFRDQIFMAGRKMDESAIAVSHEILGGFSTKAILNESEYVVIFPHCNQEPIKKLMLKKYNFSKSDVEWVLSRPTRWVLIKRSQPQAFITSTEIRVL
jgi:hypothetical protein